MVEVVATKDNTDVNKLRRRMDDIVKAVKESLLREISRFEEEMEDLDLEIQEGMSNRVGSGFQGNEAMKYAKRLVNPIMGDTLEDLDGIKNDLITDIAGLVGEEFVQDQISELGGLIGNANAKNFEMSQLAIQELVPPAKVPTKTVE